MEKFLRTWPAGVRPKLHFSSPRTEMRELQIRHRKTGKKEAVRQQPLWTGHADFCQPFEFSGMMRALGGLEFDVMLEAKAKDLALIRLRQDAALRAGDRGAVWFGDAVVSLSAEARSARVCSRGKSFPSWTR